MSEERPSWYSSPSVICDRSVECVVVVVVVVNEPTVFCIGVLGGRGGWCWDRIPYLVMSLFMEEEERRGEERRGEERGGEEERRRGEEKRREEERRGEEKRREERVTGDAIGVGGFEVATSAAVLGLSGLCKLYCDVMCCAVF